MLHIADHRGEKNSQKSYHIPQGSLASSVELGWLGQTSSKCSYRSCNGTHTAQGAPAWHPVWGNRNVVLPICSKVPVLKVYEDHIK